MVKVPEGKVRMMVVGAEVGVVMEALGVVLCALVIELDVLNTLLVVNGPVVVGVLVVGVRSEDTEYVGSNTILVVVVVGVGVVECPMDGVVDPMLYCLFDE